MTWHVTLNVTCHCRFCDIKQKCYLSIYNEDAILTSYYHSRKHHKVCSSCIIMKTLSQRHIATHKIRPITRLHSCKLIARGFQKNQLALVLDVITQVRPYIDNRSLTISQIPKWAINPRPIHPHLGDTAKFLKSTNHFINSGTQFLNVITPSFSNYTE